MHKELSWGTSESFIKVSCMLQRMKKTWLLSEAHRRHIDDLCLGRAFEIHSPGTHVVCTRQVPPRYARACHSLQVVPTLWAKGTTPYSSWGACCGCAVVLLSAYGRGHLHDFCHSAARWLTDILIHRVDWSWVCQEAFFRTKLQLLSVITALLIMGSFQFALTEDPI